MGGGNSGPLFPAAIRGSLGATGPALPAPGFPPPWMTNHDIINPKTASDAVQAPDARDFLAATIRFCQFWVQLAILLYPLRRFSNGQDFDIFPDVQDTLSISVPEIF